MFLGASLLPVYVFGSGGVQPTHLLLAGFAGLKLLTRGIPVTGWLLALFAVFLHSLAVESIYVMAGGNAKFLINAVFFFYNALLTGAVYVHTRENGLSTLVPGILVAAGIALVTILVTGVSLRDIGDVTRATGTFNNPNQLGYFSVCLLSFAYLFYREGRVSYWIAVTVFSVSLYLAIASLSKAAMLANFIVIIVALKPVSSRNALLGWLVVIIAGMVMLLHLYQNGALDSFIFMERLANMANENDSSLASRGYFAILEGNLAQMLFGLGGEIVDDIVGHEVHSTLGSVLNNYGLVGLALFSIALAVWVLRLWQGYGAAGFVCLAGPPLLYGITHNGVRFTIFWLLFSASMAMARNRCAMRTQDDRRRSTEPGRRPLARGAVS
ncbi:O-antigen ligase family protein [Roseovarius amoyensis]|uniref:O-antigen ligase family protein n=1 Tax=Roseovarius amoyensis TaxID=2211448 RepID=UPI000DBE1C7A|nr:hypothetical protein [Roseovarius amoyensis]